MELHKILTMSAKDYAESAGKPLSGYNAIGMHITVDSWMDKMASFIRSVPPEAEVVVDFKPLFDGHSLMYHATALVPKDIYKNRNID